MGLDVLDAYAYTYDAVGNRTSMTDPDGTHNYTYDAIYQLTQATHPAPQLPNNPAEGFAYDKVGNRISSHRSAAYVDNVGNIVQTYYYDSFGNIVEQTGTVENPYTYTGREYDAESGLYYYRARYYEAKIGRFLNEDPIGFAGGDINFYRYSANNSVNLIDPFGLTWASNWNFLSDFLSGKGDTLRNYDPNTIETREMQNSPGANALRDKFYRNNGENITNFNYSTYQAAKDTILNPASADLSNTAFQVGGFGGATAINNGDGTVTFTIRNVAGGNSLFYHIPWANDKYEGKMRNITQVFQWKEKIKCR